MQINPTQPRRYLRFPPRPRALSKGQLLIHLLRGALLFPFYWLAAAMAGAPAMLLRWRFFWFGLRLLAANGDRVAAYRCIVSPMDSVRHFEFEFFWQRLGRSATGRLLDVSSPRLLPLMLLNASPGIRADLINPDGKDLQRTMSIAATMGLTSRCRFDSNLIGQADLKPSGFQVITCMSVLEHIVDDISAVQVMWSVLAPGGKLLISVPCAAQALEEYTDLDEYSLLERDREGFVFWQRYYDDAMLARIFAVTGTPASFAIFGEKVPGSYDADVNAKRTDPFYAHWRDCLQTARTYRTFATLEQLPGMGVIAMEFVKPSLSEPEPHDTREPSV